MFGAHRTKRLVQEARDLPTDISYTAYALVHEIAKADPGDLAVLASHGLRSIILGIETPDAETLRLYRKSVRSDTVRKVIAKLHDAGISAQGCLMVGIPEVSLDDTLYTIDYALELDIDIRRWHTFQPDFARPPKQIELEQGLTISRFADIDVNLPDHLLPQLFGSASNELFLEEHFLMRAIPYADQAPEDLGRIQYSAGYSLRDLYERLLERLKPTKTLFNEEDYFRILDSAHPIQSQIVDHGSWLQRLVGEGAQR